MKKLFIILLFAASNCLAASIPDNVYFNAMKDEMARTKEQLKLDGFARPSFIVYKLIEKKTDLFLASFGALVRTSDGQNSTSLDALVYFPVGGQTQNSSGFENNRFYYWPERRMSIANSYEGIRTALWEASDYHYLDQLDTLSKKEAFLRQKQIKEVLPDFSPAARAEFYQPVAFKMVDTAYFEQLVKQLSALGQQYKHIQKFTVQANVAQQTDRYLNSEGSFFEQNSLLVTLIVNAHVQNKDGYKTKPSLVLRFTSLQLPPETELADRVREFLQQAQNSYDAPKAEPYLGPVLFKPSAAAEFLNYFFVQNVQFSKPLLVPAGEDNSAGGFKDSLGLRVISNLLEVSDQPTLATYKGEALYGFTPVDDEGVKAQDIVLVKNGKLAGLPTTRSLIKGQKNSNGHARMSRYLLPRAALSNVFFTPKKPLTPQELEKKLLQRCQELDLEYCYIVDSLDSWMVSGGEVNAARIYTSDGRKEQVYGVKIKNVTPRGLRDISAAGSDETINHFRSIYDLPMSLIAPSLLVEEVEIAPSEIQPERKPFVAQP